MPPAAQIDTSPYCTSRRAISFAMVVMMRPPVAPNGCPIAIERCRQDEPELTDPLGERHLSRCHLVGPNGEPPPIEAGAAVRMDEHEPAEPVMDSV